MAVRKDKRDAPLQEIKLDPAVQAYMRQGEQAEINAQREKEVNLTAYQRRKRAQDAKRIKGTYDLPENIKERIDEWAEAEGVPSSHLVGLLLAYALESDLDIKAYKTSSRHPGFDYFLEIPNQFSEA